MTGLRPPFPLSPVCFRSLVPSRFHFPASLGSAVVARFLATTDALTSPGRLFGPLPGMNTVPVPVGKFTAYPANVSCHSVSNHVMCAFGRFFCHPHFFSARQAGFGPGLSTVSQWSLGLCSRLRVYIAHSPVTPHRIEFTGGGLAAPLALRTGSSLSVALHGRITPPQLLSTTGWLTRPDRDFHPATLSSSQSHYVAPNGAWNAPRAVFYKYAAPSGAVMAHLYPTVNQCFTP
jgi:hypothetical protein